MITGDILKRDMEAYDWEFHLAVIKACNSKIY